MALIDSKIQCPSCHGPMAPRVLCCDPCDLRVEGRFRASEFESLTPEMLHFLRIFVHCEGRIKDMERSLGVSYPTVKTMIAQLKTALQLPDESAPESTPIATPESEPESNSATAPTSESSPLAILALMESGKLPYDEGLRQLKAAKKNPK